MKYCVTPLNATYLVSKRLCMTVLMLRKMAHSKEQDKAEKMDLSLSRTRIPHRKECRSRRMDA